MVRAGAAAACPFCLLLHARQAQPPATLLCGPAVTLRRNVKKAVAVAFREHDTQHRAAARAMLEANATRLREALAAQQRMAAAWPRHEAPLPRVATPGSTWPADVQEAGLAASLAAAAPAEPAAAGSMAPVPGGSNRGARSSPASPTSQQRRQGERAAAAARPAPPKPLRQLRAVASSGGRAGGGLQAWVLPSHAPLPQYKAWSHARENRLSLEVGLRMFYTDERGETVPFEEGEERPEERDLRLLSGTRRARQEAAIAAVLQRCGGGERVLQARGV